MNHIQREAKFIEHISTVKAIFDAIDVLSRPENADVEPATFTWLAIAGYRAAEQAEKEYEALDQASTAKPVPLHRSG